MKGNAQGSKMPGLAKRGLFVEKELKNGLVKEGGLIRKKTVLASQDGALRSSGQESNRSKPGLSRSPGLKNRKHKLEAPKKRSRVNSKAGTPRKEKEDEAVQKGLKLKPTPIETNGVKQRR